MNEIIYPLAVIGGGSAGIGAALAAARLGVETVLIERDGMLGGTAVNAGVSCWEPVAGATGIPFDIYRELEKIPGAAGIYSMGRHCCHPDHNEPPFPGGESIIDPQRNYSDTLLRCGTKGIVADAAKVRAQWHGVIFEPEIYAATVQRMLLDTGTVRILLNRTVTAVDKESIDRIDAVTLDDGTVIRARYWIDACGVLARLAGAECLAGEDAAGEFQEPDAPRKPSSRLNGVTLIFRITPDKQAVVEPLPPDVPESCWWRKDFPVMSCVAYPDGGRNCNMLPLMSGEEYLALGEDTASAECRRRVFACWHHIQRGYPEFQFFRLQWIAPRIGVRETFRVRCEYMLNENDLLLGISGQTHDDIIAVSDHMMDVHGGSRKACGELQQPYGIPYHCLIPLGMSNLLVAGRIAGFSSIAASSCRLSRTMIQLGQAAGSAAALSLETFCRFPEINIGQLRWSLLKQNVRLTWTMKN
ncbi:MAG: FAD-dependent oxidoreductase [Lentisphaerota bacterium]